MKRWLLRFLVLILLAPAGCRTRLAGDGHTRESPKATIYVVTETGASPLSDVEAKQREQVRSFLERDLVNVLSRRGRYQARVMRSRGEFTGRPGEYLLRVQIVKYHAGSKAARIVVGFGAGAASLDISYELYGEGANPILTGSDGVGSSRDWRNCARKLNERLLTAVMATLRDIPISPL